MNDQKTFVGYGWGAFDAVDNRTGRPRRQDYANAFFMESFNGEENSDYHFGGVKAVKYGCIGPEVFKDIEIGSQVLVYFNSKGKVQYMEVVSEASPSKAASK